MSLSFSFSQQSPQSSLALIPKFPSGGEKKNARRDRQRSARWKLSTKVPISLIGREVTLRQPGFSPRARQHAVFKSESIFFPFGRPGNGAPLFDPVERFRGSKRMLPSFANSAEAEKNKKQQAVKGVLDAQIEEKRARQLEEFRRKESEDRLEEERVEKQRRELESAYRRELHSRKGLKHLANDTEKSSKGPYFKRKPHLKKISQSLQMDDMISIIKSTAEFNSQQRREVLLDFEEMRRQLHRTEKLKLTAPQERLPRLQDEFSPLASAGRHLLHGTSDSFSQLQHLSFQVHSSAGASFSPAARSQLFPLDRFKHFIEDDVGV